jgi:hypothetical protein
MPKKIDMDGDPTFIDHLELLNDITNPLIGKGLFNYNKKQIKELRKLAAFSSDRFREIHKPNANIFGISSDVIIGKRIKRSAFKKAEKILSQRMKDEN